MTSYNRDTNGCKIYIVQGGFETYRSQTWWIFFDLDDLCAKLWAKF